MSSSTSFAVCRVVCLSVFLSLSILAPAATRYVPADYSTIQDAINAAMTDDTVIVSPGTYYENITFNGKNIVLTSTNLSDPNSTVIDGGGSGRVVTFAGSETSNCQLRGFGITHGYSNGDGGGILGNGAHAAIEDCVITGNTANNGGGLYSCYGSITNCMITDNTAINNFFFAYGGGLCSCDGSITNCTITGNTAYYGGGLCGCDGLITNCMVVGNTAVRDGGGAYSCYGSITNCTIIGNTANYGGGLYRYSGITNCILWANSAVKSYDQLYDGSVPTYSCIQDWTGGGEGNISKDPVFVDISSADPSFWDLHLLPNSPCIDRATNTPPGGLPATDIEGNPRPFDGDMDGNQVADMGAYEFHDIPNEAYLCVFPQSLSFTGYEAGDVQSPHTISIRNWGIQNLNWSMDLAGKPDWLLINPTSDSLEHGESSLVTVSVDITGLSGGPYSYTFEVADPLAQNSPQWVTVELTVIGPILELSGTTFSPVVLDEGGPNPDPVSLTISNPGGGILDWSMELNDKPDWLVITPTGGSLSHDESVPVTLSMDITGLTAGMYSYAFEVADPAAQSSPQTVTVQLVVRWDYIIVPDDVPAIQTAIDYIAEYGTIVVKSGTYYENLRFPGRDFVLTSTNPTDPNIVASTVIDGNQNGRCITFAGSETSACRLRGFTITKGLSYGVGGIYGDSNHAAIE